VHGWDHSRCHLCGCCRPVSGHTVRGVSERGPAINQGPHQIKLGEYKGSAGSSRVLRVSFSCFPEFYLGSNKSIEVEWEAWEGRLGVLVRNLRTMMVIH